MLEREGFFVTLETLGEEVRRPSYINVDGYEVHVTTTQVEGRGRVFCMKVFVLLLCASLYFAAPLGAAGLAAARRGAAQNTAKVRVKGRGSVVVSERGRSHALDLTKHVDAARIEDASVLFLTREGGQAFLLLDVCGLSKMPPDDRQCGAGTECNLVWLKLDGRWRVLDAKSERYESCWLPITSDEGPKVSGRRLTLVYEDLREGLRHEVTYDADRPRAGLVSATRPVPPPE